MLINKAHISHHVFRYSSVKQLLQQKVLGLNVAALLS